MPTRIICAGLMRSGSTWQFNTIRLLAAATGRSTYAAYIADYDPVRPEAIHVVKAHDPSETRHLNPVLAVTSYRDLRGVFNSLVRMRWQRPITPGEIADYFAAYTAMLQSWESVAVHSMRYEAMMADRLAETTRTAKALNFELTEAQIETVCARVLDIRPPAAAPTGRTADYDRETLLHPGHISAGPVPASEVSHAHIERIQHKWLSDRGYAIPR